MFGLTFHGKHGNGIDFVRKQNFQHNPKNHYLLERALTHKILQHSGKPCLAQCVLQNEIQFSQEPCPEKNDCRRQEIQNYAKIKMRTYAWLSVGVFKSSRVPRGPGTIYIYIYVIYIVFHVFDNANYDYG